MTAEKYDGFIRLTLKNILATDSPTGFPHLIIGKLRSIIEDLGYKADVSNKNVVSVFVKGKSSQKRIAVSAHVDTLGLMVRSISSDGTLRITRLGGPLMPTLDGEYCRIYSRDGKIYTGTIISDSPSVHVYPDAKSLERSEEHMHVRIDEEVYDEKGVKALEIENGCFIAYDTKTVMTESGFIKSRFLDDKAGSACLLTALKIFKEEGIVPEYDCVFCFTNYEEVGHGAATVGKDCDELLAVDMGCMGLDLSCKETQVSVCAKDGHGPYDYDVTNKLINVAKKANIDYAVDVYPFYGSDVGASWSAGQDLKGGLIGPGVCASHGMERTHIKGLYNTIELILEYLGTK